MSSTLPQRLKFLRELYKMTKLGFANATGISPSYLTRAEKGERTPSGDILIKVAKYFNIRLEWLMTGEGAMKEEDMTKKEFINEEPETYQIPYLIASAGGGYAAEEGNFITISKKEIDHNINPKNILCTQIRGDSMSPEILDKDILIIDTNSDRFIDGEVYIVGHEDNIYCKKVLLNINQIILESTNPKYPPQFFEGDMRQTIQVIGRVIAQIRKRG